MAAGTAELRFRVMGTEAHVLAVDAPPALVEQARTMLRRLDARWTRFSAQSELSRLNASAGTPVVLPDDTFDLVSRAVAAWHLTTGLFDPTTHDALMAAGYDRTFGQVSDDGDPPGTPVPAPGCAGISLWPATATVLLPPRTCLDLGGIGKGYAADVVAKALVGWGAAGACVNLGGDVRVTGTPPDGADAWLVAVDDADGDELLRVRLTEGAVVTTTPLTRRWRRGGRVQHHLIDPRTGAPAWTGIASVTVLGADASWAEVFAKAAYLAGTERGIETLHAAGLTGVIVGDDGDAVVAPGMEAFLACALT